jgi:hypothetical protein
MYFNSIYLLRVFDIVFEELYDAIKDVFIDSLKENYNVKVID